MPVEVAAAESVMNSTSALSFPKLDHNLDRTFNQPLLYLEDLLPSSGAFAWEKEVSPFVGSSVAESSGLGGLDDLYPLLPWQSNQVPRLEFKDFEDIWDEFGMCAKDINQSFFNEDAAVVVVDAKPLNTVAGDITFDQLHQSEVKAEMSSWRSAESSKDFLGEFGMWAHETNSSFSEEGAVYVHAKPLIRGTGGITFDPFHKSTGMVERSSWRSSQTSSEAIFQNGRLVKSSTGLQLDEIRKYFDVPITRAAKELKVGLTVLKRRCRELNIMRWPHRKIKSLKFLIQNAKDLGLTDEVEMLEEHQKMLHRIPEMELTERTKKLRQACFKANYKKRRALALAAGQG